MLVKGASISADQHLVFGPLSLEVQLLGPKHALLAVDVQAKLMEPLEQELEVLQVRSQVWTAYDDVIQVHKDEWQAICYPVYHFLKSVAVLRSTKPIFKNSYRPNGVMMAVLAMSLACMGIWW
jgi:hypothetical protein